MGASHLNARELVRVEAAQGISKVRRLDRGKWRSPLISVIVTHHNYSDHIEDGLLSVLDQTYGNWECVVVDDASGEEHRRALEGVVSAIGSDRVKSVWLDENVGQTHAFYAGLDQTGGEFVCLLDPDDRYAETFIEELLRAHLNPVVYCPLVCSDQVIVRNGAVIAGVGSAFNMHLIKNGEIPAAVPCQLVHFPPEIKGWHWTSTSSMMFRRPAIELMRPRRPLAYKRSADAYLARGAHLLGGSLFLNQPLVYRHVHKANSWLTDEIFSIGQIQSRPNRIGERLPFLSDVTEAIKANGGGHHLIRQERRQSRLKRWRWSVEKRWRRWLRR